MTHCPCADYHRAMRNAATCRANGLPADHPLLNRYERRAQVCKRLAEKLHPIPESGTACPLDAETP